jgi:SAM-dependent methyltransferase
MNQPDRRQHWETVYSTKGENEVSWSQASPSPSLELLQEAGARPDSAIIDVGGGASRLVDALVRQGFARLSVLDISQAALDATRERLGNRADQVRWIAADITAWEPDALYDIWHDRAAFHFLTVASDRVSYRDQLLRALKPGGHAIIGTFAPGGPEKCSGLPVMRHDMASLQQFLGGEFEPVASRPHQHTTPWGTAQHFQFSTFRRTR